MAIAMANFVSGRFPVALLPMALLLGTPAVAVFTPPAIAQQAYSLESAESLFQAARLLEAITHYQQVLTAAQQTGDQQQRAQALLGLGRTYYWISQPDEAIAILTQAQNLYTALDDSAGLADTLVELTIVQLNQEQFDQGDANLTQALSLYQRLGDEQGQARVFTHQGNRLIRIGEVAAGIEQLEQALAIQQRLGDDAGKIQTLTWLGIAQQVNESLD